MAPLDGSVNDPSATDLIVAAVDQLLRNIVMSLLMDKSSYKLGHDANKTPHSVGSAAPNPYLVTKQRSDDFNGELSKPSAQGNLLKGIDNKTVSKPVWNLRSLGYLHPTFILLWFHEFL